MKILNATSIILVVYASS